MFLSKKKQIDDLLDSIILVLENLFNNGNIEENILDLIKALNVIGIQIEKEKTLLKMRKQLDFTDSLLRNFVNERTVVNVDTVNKVLDSIKLLKQLFLDDVHIQLNILFLPYNASMWDSLVSIYEESLQDPDCVVSVVPIPYYQITEEGKKPVYEGDLFPNGIPIIHYNEYNFDEQLPDVIYVHNIYDKFNKVTQVHEFFFTENLKRYTDMLVYVPYHISEPHKATADTIRAAYYLPGIKYVDKVVLPGKFIEEEALNAGIPRNKILTLGSPKFDSMIKSLAKDIKYPAEWEKHFSGKKVILLTTSCGFFCNGKFSNVDLFNIILDIPRYIDNVVLLWRPHPLTLQTTQRFKPEIVENIKMVYERFRTGKETFASWENMFIDEEADYFPSLKVADMMITDGGSLMQAFLLTEKSIVLFASEEEISEHSLLPSDAFYYFFDKKMPWYKLIKKFANGFDPLEDKRKGLAATVYENVDGSCGKRVHDSIKEYVFGRYDDSKLYN